MSNVATQWTDNHSKLLLAMALSPSEVGQRIQDARVQKGWTQVEFAFKANVSPSSVARWEGGKLPPVRELIRISELLEVEVDSLVEPAQPRADARLEALEARVDSNDSNFEKVLEVLERLEARLDGLAVGPAVPPKKKRAS